MELIDADVAKNVFPIIKHLKLPKNRTHARTFGDAIRKISLFPPGKVPYFSVQCLLFSSQAVLLLLADEKKEIIKRALIECGAGSQSVLRW